VLYIERAKASSTVPDLVEVRGSLRQEDIFMATKKLFTYEGTSA
jgi:hypothetical protein